MEEVTAAKFLLANGHELLSLRNPLDYACRVCLKCHFTYSNAETLFNKFNFQRDKSQYIDESEENPNDDFTQKIKSETKQLIKKGKISFEDYKEKFLATMLKYQKSFRLNKGNSGYSFRNIERFKVFFEVFDFAVSKGKYFCR